MTFETIPFPSRPVAATRSVFSPPRGFAFTILVLGALAVFLGWWQGPGLIRDLQINQNPLELYDYDFDGECTMRRGITDCEVDLTYSHEGQNYESHVSFAFIDFHSGDYEAGVVISADKPELATLTLGLDMLWNRLAVFCVLMLIVVGGAIVMVFNTIQALSANGKVRHPAPGRLVAVDIGSVQEQRGKVLVNYIDHPKGPRSKRQSNTSFASGQAPLTTFDDKGQLVGVAFQRDDRSLPVLLDDRLERVDITPEERNAALAAVAEINQRFAGQPATEAAKKKKGMNPALRGLMAGGGVIVLCILGGFGYWIYYVTSAPSQYDQIGMEINNILPGPLNEWGCDQLQKRFGDQNAPFGCTAADYTSWK